jgi:hypothetical protein
MLKLLIQLSAEIAKWRLSVTYWSWQ